MRDLVRSCDQPKGVAGRAPAAPAVDGIAAHLINRLDGVAETEASLMLLRAGGRGDTAAERRYVLAATLHEACGTILAELGDEGRAAYEAAGQVRQRAQSLLEQEVADA